MMRALVAAIGAAGGGFAAGTFWPVVAILAGTLLAGFAFGVWVLRDAERTGRAQQLIQAWRGVAQTATKQSAVDARGRKALPR